MPKTIFTYNASEDPDTHHAYKSANEKAQQLAELVNLIRPDLQTIAVDHFSKELDTSQSYWIDVRVIDPNAS